MNSVINRQALCDDLREYKVHPVPVSSDESEIKGYNDGIDLAISVITNFPSTELKWKNGKWIKHENPTLGHCMKIIYECSVCHKAVGCEYFVRRSFCPNCGADMRGE